MKNPTTTRRFSMILIGQDGCHGYQLGLRSMSDVNQHLESLGDYYVNVVIVGPTTIGAGVTTAIATRVGTAGKTGTRFEVLQPQDRKQIQLWLLEEAKERDPEPFAAAASVVGTRRKKSLSKAELARLKGTGKPPACGAVVPSTKAICSRPVGHRGPHQSGTQGVV